ncbi:MAG: helix-turn-helix transcriptional regulator [Muribaculaceae bacterium]|nr:helix-turn-helix transcriptional regulator [Muribaculaceae bacterium]
MKKLYEEKKKAQVESPARAMIKDLAAATGRSELTVRMWISGKFKPEKLICNIIADTLNVDAAYLFPEKEVVDGL